MSKELLKETIRLLIKERSATALEDAIAKAFKEKDPRSIRYAAKVCLNSGMPQSKLNDMLNAAVEKGGSPDVAKEIADVLDDPENWSSYHYQSPQEKAIAKLNI